MRFTAIVAILLSSITLLGCGTMGQGVIDAYSVPSPQDKTYTGNAVNRDTAQLPNGGN
jgi:hypothetical protein